ncbi:cell division protein PerM [Paractinoplanes hotanensis]|uniref:DUF6350 family protein n=1 Tax=Paractinoplanes hotanensis TaxID=2906497 RepID=A0ABT0Y1I8_9ACTN|nr:DUF6350 family protein [Actinoplanes hotanensis]MCM4079897.1 DUF6350 family protein [Actinoplanes hotanensis]
MPSTPERPDDSDDPFAVAEATQVAHDTEPIAVGRPTEAVAQGTGPVSRETVDVAREQRTVLVDDEVLGNRQTVRLPTQRRPPQRPQSRAPLPVAAAFATLWAALLSYVPVAAVVGLARTLEGSGGLAGAAHAGLAGWMLGHGVSIGTSIGALGLAPLLLSMLIVWRLNRAGLHVTRAVGARRTGSTSRALSVAFAIALTYSLLGSILALVVDGKGTEVTAGRAALNFFLIGLAGSLAGSLRGTDALSVWAGRLPGPLRHGVRTGVIAALFVLAAGAAVTGLSIALGGGQAADMISAYRTGVAGQAGITLVSLAYGVNGSVWAAAYLLGPGFALGTGSIVRLTEVTVGPLPTLPLLAGLPNGPMGAAGTLLLALPVLAGLAAGWLLTLRLTREGKEAGEKETKPRELAWPLVLGSGLIAGPVAGILLGLAAEFSGGPLGDDRMATIGPDPWQVGLLATAVLGVSAALGAAAARMFRTPKA